MTLDEKFDIVQFERQAKASVMIQTLLDFWESGHEEVPGLTRQYVDETIRGAMEADSTVTDTLVEAHGMYVSGQQHLLENILGNHSRQSRRNIIRFLPDDAPKQVIEELDDLLYLLPLVKLTFDDFFADGNKEIRYSHSSNFGMPFSVEAILGTYSLNEHQMSKNGTANKLYLRFRKMPKDERKTAIEELLQKTGYTEIFKEYSQSRIYFFSADITLAKLVFEDFFKGGNDDVWYSRSNNFGMPLSVKAILCRYSLQEHGMVVKGTANKLYYRYHVFPEDERKTAIEELLQKTGYTETFKGYSSSKIYFFSDEVALVKSVFDDFFAEGNKDTRYSHSSNFGMPFSVEAILDRYSSQEHQMVPFGTAGRISSRLRKMPEDEKKKAVEELLQKTGYTEIFEQYLQSNRNNPFVPPPVETQQPCTAPRTP